MAARFFNPSPVSIKPSKAKASVESVGILLAFSNVNVTGAVMVVPPLVNVAGGFVPKPLAVPPVQVTCPVAVAGDGVQLIPPGIVTVVPGITPVHTTVTGSAPIPLAGVAVQTVGKPAGDATPGVKLGDCAGVPVLIPPGMVCDAA